MKKSIILSIIVLMACTIQHSKAKTPDGCIEYIYQAPSYQVKDTVLPLGYGVSQIFSFIEINDNTHDETDSIGFPSLPQFLLNLNVPKNACNYVITLTARQMDTFYVSKPLLPVQDDMLENDTNATFRMNSSFYLSSDTFLNFNPVLLEEYITFGEKGILLSINPFRYVPSEGLVIVLTQTVIMVTYNLEEEENAFDQRVTISTGSYFRQLFANYNMTRDYGDLDRENYLIITAPEFENTVSEFAQYKSNLGYNVTVVNTNITGTSSSSIKNYILNQYNNTVTRPEYVLLVGDVDKIPASAGVDGNQNNPITDLEYALLDGNDEKADVYLGRFSVQSSAQLVETIRKTMYMEQNIQSFSKTATLVSGHSQKKFDGQRRFKKALETIRPNLENAGFTCQKIYGQDGGTKDNATDALNDDNLYYIYRGHGVEAGLVICKAEYNNNCGPDCDDISSSSAHTYPIFLSVACRSGDYAWQDGCCFGEHCLRDSHGASAFWGATIDTDRGKNNKMLVAVFSHFSEDLTLSAWLQLGINDFYKPKNGRKKHIRAYNLLGDPSLKLGGMDCFYNYIFTQNVNVSNGNSLSIQAEHLIRNDNAFTVNNGASVSLQAGEEIVLTDGFYAAEGSDFEAVIAPCSGRTVQQGMAERNTVLPMNHAYMPQQDSSSTSVSGPESRRVLKIFPNPVSGMLYLQLPDGEAEVERIVVSDMLGRVMLRKDRLTGSEIDVSALPAGMYLLKLRTAAGAAFTGKFVKN